MSKLSVESECFLLHDYLVTPNLPIENLKNFRLKMMHLVTH